MSVKLRLQRHGKKGKPYYWLVASDARAKRDGRHLEKIGTYDPNTNPATINLNSESAIRWLENGAQPTKTARALLSYKGVLLKLHLKKGIAKNALTQEQADEKYEAWLKQKQDKIQAKVNRLEKDKTTELESIKETERKISEARVKTDPQTESENSKDDTTLESNAGTNGASEETTQIKSEKDSPSKT